MRSHSRDRRDKKNLSNIKISIFKGLGCRDTLEQTMDQIRQINRETERSGQVHKLQPTQQISRYSSYLVDRCLKGFAKVNMYK